MASLQRFEEIKAWQRARQLVRDVYKVCRSTPLGRDFGMRDQLCRAAVSVMSNIAEGFSRRTDKEFAHFLDIARGSCGEVQSLLYVALDVEYVSQPVFQQLFSSASATAALIHGFASYLRGERQQSDADSRRPDVDSR